MPAAERPRRGRRGLIPAVLIPALVAGIAVLVLSGRGGPARPSGSAAQLAQQADRARDLGEYTTRAVQAGGGSADVRSGGARPAVPVHISIPSADVNTAVDAVGAPDGPISVPSIGLAGWWKGGPRPGERGRAVIIGHLDTARGPGLFAKVPGLQPHTLIDVTDRRGAVHRYRVVGRAQVRKDRFPTSEVYGGGRTPVLVLVTCGGPYIQGKGYRDNVLIYARAAPA